MASTQRCSAAQRSIRGRNQGHPLRMGVKRSGPTNPAVRPPSRGRFHVNRQVANAVFRKVDPLWPLQITNRWVLIKLARSRPAPNQRSLIRACSRMAAVSDTNIPRRRPPRAKKYYTREGMAREAARIRRRSHAAARFRGPDDGFPAPIRHRPGGPGCRRPSTGKLREAQQVANRLVRTGGAAVVQVEDEQGVAIIVSVSPMAPWPRARVPSFQRGRRGGIVTPRDKRPRPC